MTGTISENAPVDLHGIYVHFPYCFHKCGYCDFYSIAENHNAPEKHQLWLDAVAHELENAPAHWKFRGQTVFIGGGTPTLLSPELWERFLQLLQAQQLIISGTEVTVEANPETLTPELLQTLIAGGVNRLSIGAQSFNRDLLKTLERWHDPDKLKTVVAWVREAGIYNYNLDLIFAIPGQTPAQLHEDLDQALALEPTHLSCYSLIFEPGTPLHQRRQMGQVASMDNDLEAQMYQIVIQRLADAGYEHYEVSNWAKTVRHNTTAGSANDASQQTPNASEQTGRCQHNLLYWENANWLGLGPSAASHVNGVRWRNVRHLGRYLASANNLQSPGDAEIDQVEQLDADARIGETLMLSLRLIQGIALPHLAELVPAQSRRAAEINRLVQAQLLEQTDTHLRLTARGLMVADSVLAELL